MEERHQPIEGIKWREMDVRNMVGVSDGSVDVAFDKSTLDAMVHGSPWNPPDSVKENIRKYLNEVGFWRALDTILMPSITHERPAGTQSFED